MPCKLIRQTGEAGDQIATSGLQCKWFTHYTMAAPKQFDRLVVHVYAIQAIIALYGAASTPSSWVKVFKENS